MPWSAPRLCACGTIVASGEYCACQIKRRQESRARHDASRPSARERGYDTKWDRERKAFLAVHCRCAMPDCNAVATVVDHKIPHRGDRGLFWSRSNWQPLCVPCHSSRKQRQERAECL